MPIPNGVDCAKTPDLQVERLEILDPSARHELDAFPRVIADSGFFYVSGPNNQVTRRSFSGGPARRVTGAPPGRLLGVKDGVVVVRRPSPFVVGTSSVAIVRFGASATYPRNGYVTFSPTEVLLSVRGGYFSIDRTTFADTFHPGESPPTWYASSRLDFDDFQNFRIQHEGNDFRIELPESFRVAAIGPAGILARGSENTSAAFIVVPWADSPVRVTGLPERNTNCFNFSATDRGFAFVCGSRYPYDQLYLVEGSVARALEVAPNVIFNGLAGHGSWLLISHVDRDVRTPETVSALDLKTERLHDLGQYEPDGGSKLEDLYLGDGVAYWPVTVFGQDYGFSGYASDWYGFRLRELCE